ncbi:MAG TPA: YsnF/AvaK domain-containing protein [Symbiobacteriaceae bacterium]|nr:YsnF/AvaK domain-containing protein [Symbiobacteriaceae bacterium]
MVWVYILAGLLLLAAVVYYLTPRPARKQDTATMVLREEQLDIRKTREQLADVSTRKEVTREMKTVTVPVTREDFVVEKDGVEVARIPLCEEQVDVATRRVPLNEVSVHKREWEEDREIQALLKKEVARVEVTGQAEYVEETNDRSQV